MIGLNDNIQSTLKFINYVVDKSIYKTNKNFREERVKLDIKIDKSIKYSKDSNELLVTLKCYVFEDAEIKNYPFSLFVQVTGNFEANDVPEGEFSTVTNINAVSILFPYIRSLISTLTANFNVQPLILPPINVIRLFENDVQR